MTYDPDARLDTGMKASEAVQRASAWWDREGSLQMRHYMVQRTRTKRQPNKTAFVSADPWLDEANFIPSAILQGKPWAELSREEALQVVKAWHHNHVRIEQTGGHVWSKGACGYCGMLYAVWQTTQKTCDVAGDAFGGGFAQHVQPAPPEALSEAADPHEGPAEGAEGGEAGEAGEEAPRAPVVRH